MAQLVKRNRRTPPAVRELIECSGCGERVRGLRESKDDDCAGNCPYCGRILAGQRPLPSPVRGEFMASYERERLQAVRTARLNESQRLEAQRRAAEHERTRTELAALRETIASERAEAMREADARVAERIARESAGDEAAKQGTAGG